MVDGGDRPRPVYPEIVLPTVPANLVLPPPQAKNLVDSKGGKTFTLPIPTEGHAPPKNAPKAGGSDAEDVIVILSGPMAGPPISKESGPSAPLVLQVGHPDKSMALIGRVETWRKTVRLRYAAADVEDDHGGCVTLVGDRLEKLQEGQQVRVQGWMLPAEERATGPRFQVQSLQVLEK